MSRKLTYNTNEFIERANKTHDNKYDYSLVEYVGCSDKVKIVCSEHGSFERTPSEHLRGRCCPQCNKNSRVKKNMEKFIKLAKEIYDNKYDYSQVQYINNTTRVNIICPDHGMFSALPTKHTGRKYKCPECTAEERSDSIEFVAAEIEKRGGILLDSLSNGRSYIKSTQRIKVQCRECTKTWTPKWQHVKINNRWCGICTVKYRKSRSFEELQTLAEDLNCKITRFPDNPLVFVNNTDSIDYVCKKCDSLYEDVTVSTIVQAFQKNHYICKYCSSFEHIGTSVSFEEAKKTIEDYDFKVLSFPDNGKIKRIRYRDSLLIQCSNQHPPFESTWENICRNGIERSEKIGCFLCGNQQRGDAQTMSLGSFLERAKEKWGDRYDYSKINEDNWANSRTKVPIICEKHGEWPSKPQIFLSPIVKYGCPDCAQEARAAKQARSQEEYEEELFTRNPKIKCLGEYKTSQTHILHRCLVCAHEWEVIPNSILNNGCPECGKTHYREGWFREVLEEIFQKPFKSTRPDWLRNPSTNRRLEIDCYNESLSLAVEYQGAQHYEPVKFFGGKAAFVQNQARDRIKSDVCRQRKIILWTFDNRKYSRFLEAEYKSVIKKEIALKAMSIEDTPSCMPTAAQIKAFFNKYP